MTEDELFARRPMGMRMAMVVRQWRAIIDAAITDTGLTQSSWTVLMQLRYVRQSEINHLFSVNCSYVLRIVLLSFK